ncbi:MAG: neutral/alkaline non-lysosomal ceramidase N-terminal domain-containing protein [Bryobacterales bacterium]|nr:neutral/alkaline non-lysosomal ceramidase N-terminal domain-containing protein [Bryobacterales bacterium]
MLRALFALLVLAAPGLAALRASAVKVDITPKTPQWLMGYGARQSTGVHDPIFHRIVALDDGATQVYLVASDLCVFSPSVYDDFAAELQKRTGIEPRQVWWTVTHTHSAPEVGPPGVYDVLLKGRSEHPWSREYLQFIQESLISGIEEARAKLEPARAAAGKGFARANINRRARDLNGTISLGLNPDGPVDRQIGLIRLDRPDGTPIALIANYAMHGTAMSGRFVEISGDAPGIVATHVEQQIGAPVLYVNGAAGNIAPIYSVQADPKSAHLGEFRVLLGNRILDAYRSLALGTADTKLWLGETWVETPRKSGLGWPAELPHYAAKGPGGADLVRIPVRFLRIGDAVAWGAPVEMFCEIAFRARDESPFPNTFFFGYTNGWLGYLPTAEAFREGGYEPRTSPFTPQVERDFGDAVVSFLDAIPRR